MSEVNYKYSLTARAAKSILSNDEVSTDEELLKHFVDELGMERDEAAEWISQREYFLNNIVMDDGSIYKPKLK